MKGVDVSAMCIIPEMIFYEHLHSDLSFWHAGIINQTGPAFRSFLFSGFWRPVTLKSIASREQSNVSLRLI